MSKLIQAKARMPEALQYNAWAPLKFDSFTHTAGASTSTAVRVMVPLGLNYKITHLSYILSDFSAAAPGGGLFADGKMALNVVSGVGAYEGAGAASSYGAIALTGNFAVNDKITVNLAGVPYSYTVSGRSVVNTFTIASSMAESLNRNTAFNALYRANSLGLEIVVQTLAYSTAVPAFSVTVVTTNSGSATAGSMVAGVAGALPAVPVSDTTGIGIVPSQTAAVGSALFPVDIVLPYFTLGSVGATTQANLTGTIYCLENFDANWPTLANLTLRLTTDGAVAGNLLVTLWGVPNDIHPMQPEESATAFHLSSFIL